MTTRDLKEVNLYEFNNFQELTRKKKTTSTKELTTF